MEVIVDNTIKNAATRQMNGSSRVRRQTKRVCFEIERNDYYDPKEWKEEPVFFDVVNDVKNVET